MHTRVVGLLFVLFGMVCAAWSADLKATAQSLLESADFNGGLIVLTQQADGNLARTLAAAENSRVLVLGSSQDVVDSIRKSVCNTPEGGRISVSLFDGKRIPCIDNMVNLLVTPRAGETLQKEAMRTLCPGGCWLQAGNKKVIKPWSEELGEFTHFLGDASNNAVSQDSRVGPPRHIQWENGPKYDRDHDALASLSAMTTSKGRLFYILDEGPTSMTHRKDNWNLFARDAFNGLLLWKRPLKDWISHLHYFRTGPTFLPRKLVSVGDRVYVTLGLAEPVSVLDAATGKVVLTLKGSEKTEEILVCDGKVVVVTGAPDLRGKFENFPTESGDFFYEKPLSDHTVKVYDADTGKLLWTTAGRNLDHYAPLSLAAIRGAVVFLDGDSLVCLDLNSGKKRWDTPFETKHMGAFKAAYSPVVVIYKDVVGCVFYDKFHVFNMKTGAKLWEKMGYVGYLAGGDLFGINGNFWTLPMTAATRVYGTKGVRTKKMLADGKELQAHDIHSGEVALSLKKSDVWTGGHHHRCHRNKATTKFLITDRSKMNFIDVETGAFERQYYLRGECQFGVLPANGLLYVPPNPCSCFLSAKLDGFHALTSEWSVNETKELLYQDRLVKGPAFGQSLKKTVYGDDEWPTYRADLKRSGGNQAKIPTKMGVKWQTKLGGALTAPVAAGGTLVVARKDNNTVYMLDQKNGKLIWQVTVGGPVDSPPTLYEGRVFFGSADGWVYCLNAETGALAWRFAAAPGIQRRVMHGSLKSVWPVHGSLPVHDGVVYCTAGQVSYLDGGIWLYALDAKTGSVIKKTTIREANAHPLCDETTPDIKLMVQSDILTLDAGKLSMRGVPLGGSNDDAQKRRRGKQTGPKSETIKVSRGFMDDTWFHRGAWTFSKTKGQLIVHDDLRAWAVENPYTPLKATDVLVPPTNLGEVHQTYYNYKKDHFPVGCWLSCEEVGKKGKKPPQDVTVESRFTGKPVTVTGKNLRQYNPAAKSWRHELPIQIRGMVLAGDQLITAAVTDKVTTGGFDDNVGEEQALLQVWDRMDGRKLGETKLPMPPIFDGLIAAKDRVYVSAQDGSIICLGQ